jgi:tetratricopeptide (TPR) repeat protein
LTKDEWFRNTTWNPVIEAEFRSRLSRARDKSQYLRIQAHYLAEVVPEAALRLLAEYFLHEKAVDHAQAQVDRARAHVALGDLDAAVTAYEAALAREREFPNLVTQAAIDLPVLIAEKKLTRHYARAIELLSEAHTTFPVERYRVHGARALLLAEVGRHAEAKQEAELALAAAREQKSGFRYHQRLGLALRRADDFARRIARVAAS